MQLPQGLSLEQMQNKWGSILNPVIANPIQQGQMLTNIPLSIGTNSINHGLGRTLLGWLVVGIDPASTISDRQASNQRPDLTLNLVSTVATTINLWVF